MHDHMPALGLLECLKSSCQQGSPVCPSPQALQAAAQPAVRSCLAWQSKAGRCALAAPEACWAVLGALESFDAGMAAPLLCPTSRSCLTRRGQARGRADRAVLVCSCIL